MVAGLLACGLLSFQRRGNEAWQRARRSRLVRRGFRYWVWSRLKLVPPFGLVSSHGSKDLPATGKRPLQLPINAACQRVARKACSGVKPLLHKLTSRAWTGDLSAPSGGRRGRAWLRPILRCFKHGFGVFEMRRGFHNGFGTGFGIAGLKNT